MRKTHREPARTPWGKAIELLRERKDARLRKAGKPEGWSQYALCKESRMPHAQYRKLLQEGRKGPSLITMQRLFNALDCTWHEWANVYKPAPIEESQSSTARNLGNEKGGSRRSSNG